MVIMSSLCYSLLVDDYNDYKNMIISSLWWLWPPINVLKKPGAMVFTYQTMAVECCSSIINKRITSRLHMGYSLQFV